MTSMKTTRIEDATLVYVNDRLFAHVSPYTLGRTDQWVIDGNLNTGAYRSMKAAMKEVRRRLALGLGR